MPPIHAEPPPLHRATWGILLADAATGRVLYAHNPEKNLIPASNIVTNIFNPDFIMEHELVFVGSSFTFGYPWQEPVIFTRLLSRGTNVSVIGTE